MNAQKDLIDKVREGYPIEIYESKPLLKEGDVLEDWRTSPYDNSETRNVVGKKIGILLLNKWLREHTCPYCGTPMHTIRGEHRYSRKGRDGKVYSYIDTTESEWHGRICPLCEFQDHKRDY